MSTTSKFHRQLDLLNPDDLTFPITIIGVGGIGSWTTLALTKMGCRNISVLDSDEVETHNTPSQFYRHKDIGEDKVQALATTIEEFTNIKIAPIKNKYQHIFDEYILSPKILIIAVDSLKERQEIWEKISQIPNKENLECLIDARMGGEFIRILTVNLKDPSATEVYVKSLFSKTKEHEEPCTARAIIYNTLIMAGLIASIVKKYVKGESLPYDFMFDITEMTGN